MKKVEAWQKLDGRFFEIDEKEAGVYESVSKALDICNEKDQSELGESLAKVDENDGLSAEEKRRVKNIIKQKNNDHDKIRELLEDFLDDPKMKLEKRKSKIKKIIESENKED